MEWDSDDSDSDGSGGDADSDEDAPVARRNRGHLIESSSEEESDGSEVCGFF